MSKSNVNITETYGGDPIYRQIQTDLSIALQEFEMSKQHLEWVKKDCKARMEKYHRELIGE